MTCPGTDLVRESEVGPVVWAPTSSWGRSRTAFRHSATQLDRKNTVRRRLKYRHPTYLGMFLADQRRPTPTGADQRETTPRSLFLWSLQSHFPLSHDDPNDVWGSEAEKKVHK